MMNFVDNKKMFLKAGSTPECPMMMLWSETVVAAVVAVAVEKLLDVVGKSVLYPHQKGLSCLHQHQQSMWCSPFLVLAGSTVVDMVAAVAVAEEVVVVA